MQSIAKLLKENKSLQEAEATLRFKNKWLNKGFTQVSNNLLDNNSVSAHARLLYFLLMRRCFQKDYSFPGVDTLAKEMGVSKRSVMRLTLELEQTNWLQIKRRGQGKTNLYYLLKF